MTKPTTARSTFPDPAIIAADDAFFALLLETYPRRDVTDQARAALHDVLAETDNAGQLKVCLLDGVNRYLADMRAARRQRARGRRDASMRWRRPDGFRSHASSFRYGRVLGDVIAAVDRASVCRRDASASPRFSRVCSACADAHHPGLLTTL